MKGKTKEQLLNELAELRRRVDELEAAEAERKRVEEALRESEHEQALILSSLSELVTYQDRELRIIWANRAAGESVGSSADELVGRQCYEIWQQRSEPCAGCPVVKALQTGELQKAEMTTSDGRVWSIKGYPVRDKNGDVVGAVEVTLEITERKRAEETLRESEERHRAIFEQAPDSIVLVDAETGALVEFNDRAHESLGYTRQEFEKLKVSDFEVIESAEGVAKHVEKIIKEGPDAFETKQRTKGGEIRDIQVSGRAISIRGKDFIQGIWRDITERKQMEEALRESEEKYRNLVERANDGVVIIQDGIVKYTNPRLAEMWGGTVEEVIGTPFTDYIHPDEVPKVLDRYKRRMAVGDVAPIYETVLRRKDGSRVYAELNAGVITYRGEPADLVIVRDITDRKRAEEALQESEEKYRTLVEQSLQGVVVIQDYRIVFANTAFARTSGYTVEELLSLSPEKLTAVIHPEDQALVWGRFRDRLAGKSVPPRYEYRGIKKDGSVIWVEIFAKRIEYQGKPAIQGAVVDITERKRAEEALRESEETARALLNAPTDSVFLIDAGGTILDVNEPTAQRLGGTPDDLLGSCAYDLFSPDVAEYRKAQADRVFRSGKPLRFEEERAGIRFDTVVYPIFNALGKVTRVAVIARDVTDRKRAEEALEHRVEQLDALSRASQAVTASLKLDQVLAEIVSLASEVSDSDYTSVVLVDESGRMGQSAENVPGVPAIRYRLRDNGFTSWIVSSHQALVVDEIDEDGVVTPDLGEGAPRLANPHIVEAGVKSLAGLPLMVKDRLLGVLYQHSLQPAAFRDQLPLLTAFANQAAIAIENARLHETVKQELTDRKRAEEALRESEARYRALIESQIDLISRYRPDTTLTFVNDAYCQFYGKTREELIGHSFLSMVAPELHELILKETENMVKDPSPIEGEYLNYKLAGEECWIQWVVQGIVDENGRVVELQAVGRDVTERKRAEEALRESEEKYRNLVERASDGITIIQDSLLKYVNPRLAAITGYTVEELIDTTFTNYIHPDELLNVTDRYERRMAGEDVPPIYETVLRRKDGSKVYVEFNAGIITYQGKPADLVIIRDITERKRAEQLLHMLNAAALAMERAITHEEIFAAVAEQLKELGFHCVVLLTDESQSRLLLKHFSLETEALQAVEELVGLKREDFPMPIETVEPYREVIQRKKTILTEDAEDVMRQLLPEPAKRLAGRIAKMLRIPKSIAAPLVVEDKVIGMLAVQADDLIEDDLPAITAFAYQVAAAWRKADLMQDLEGSLEELKRTQDQLVQTHKMEAVGRLAGGVAHDLNNILTAITGYSELLLRELNSYDPRHSDVEEIEKAAHRAATLVRQLLAFSRKQVLQPKVLDLNAVVANMEKMLRRLIREDIELTTVLDPDLGNVQADPGQIEQVIMNLAVNARDAMPQGGKLIIKTTNFYLDEDYARQHVDVQPGPHVMLAVSDIGVGMDEETLSHIFEPFFTTKEVGEGTGLGLATVYGIIKQSGGHIWAYSEPGQGTTFKVYLPRVDEPVESPKLGAAPTELLWGSETVLLAEDDDMVRGLARRVLLQNGYTVLEARHGEEALRVCEQHGGPIHLLVTDVVMPGGMSGRDLADSLTSLQPGIKVLYISGHTDDAIARHGVLEPGVTFLQKPFTPDALASKVRKVLDAPQQG